MELSKLILKGGYTMSFLSNAYGGINPPAYTNPIYMPKRSMVIKNKICRKRKERR